MSCGSESRNVTIMKPCLIHIALLTLLVLGCSQKKSNNEPSERTEIPSNMTAERMEELRWMNEPTSFDVKDGSLQVTVIRNGLFQ